MLRIAIGVALAAVFLTAMYFATMKEAGATCEVCVDFGGHSSCGSASAIDESTAVNRAHSIACAPISGGVTQGLECDRTPPRSVRCDD